MTDNNEEKEMQRLFADAQERYKPSAQLLERAKAAARPEWQAAVARASERETDLAKDNSKPPSAQADAQRPAIRHWAMAAAVVLATILIGWQWLLPSEFEVRVVHADGLRLNATELAVGSVHLQPLDEFHARSLAELAIPGPAGNFVDLRLATNTRIRWLSDNQLQLLEGSVFVDTHGTARFGVTTHAGTVTDIGTRYMATLNGKVLEVAVSEGEIELATASEQVRAKPQSTGSAAVLTVASESIRRSDEPTESGRWQWAMARSHEYQGMLIADALAAIAQRLGKTLEFHSGGDNAEAHSYTVQGSTGKLTAEEALLSISEGNNIDVVHGEKTISVSFGRR